MTLIVDSQIWQTNAWFRGMGGYVRNLLKSVKAQNPDINIILIFNKNIELSDDRIKEIKAEIPNSYMEFLDLPVDPKPGDENHANKVLNDFVDRSHLDKNKTSYLLTSLFLFKFSATFPDGVNKYMLFYDFIPLVYWKEFSKFFPANLYFSRFPQLLQADKIFTISETTSRDLGIYLGINEKHLQNIDGSINQNKTDTTSVGADIIKDHGLSNKKIILMPTGGLPHKNNMLAVQAFAKLCEYRQEDDLRLVITSFFSDLDQDSLASIGGKSVIFTGNITDGEMARLYQECEAVLFPSLYEGLGIPVLEGVKYKKPVACSDIKVFREIPGHKEALYVFNPESVTSIFNRLLEAVSASNFENKIKYYKQIEDKYSWGRAAQLFVDSIKSQKHAAVTRKDKTKIAITLPDPRKNHDVAVLAQRMLGVCRERGLEPDYFIDPGEEDRVGADILPDYIRSTAVCYDIRDYFVKKSTEKYKATLHFLSGDPQFNMVYRAALTGEGYVYIGNTGYMQHIDCLFKNGLISEEQYSAEKQIGDECSKKGYFHGLSLIQTSKGIFAENYTKKILNKTISGLKLDKEVSYLPECALVIDHENNQQTKVYKQIIDVLIGGQND